MKKRWNMMGKMAVCSFAAVMMVMAGTGLKANAEAIIDTEEEIQAVQDMVPESENREDLPGESPAEEEAGEVKIDVTEIVMIEDNLIPAAAQPELEPSEEEAAGQEEAEATDQEGEAEGSQDETREPEASGEEAQAEEQDEEPQDTDTAETGESQNAAEEKSETCVSGTITYEDSEVAVTVVASEAAQLPADTTVKVTRLAEGSAEYEAAKEAARQSVGAGENASYTFYDVTLESEGQTLDVEEGTVSVRMEFKTDAAKREVVSIEETESGKVARNVTDRTAGRAGSVALSY